MKMNSSDINDTLEKGYRLSHVPDYLPAHRTAEIFEYYDIKKKDMSEIEDSEKSYETVHLSDNVGTSFLFLSFNILWLATTACAATGQYLIVSYKQHFDGSVLGTTPFVTLFYIIFEIINIIDIISSSMHYMNKKMQILKRFKRKGIILLVLDIVSIIGIPINVYCVTVKNHEAFKRILWKIVFGLVIFRMYRAGIYFVSITSSPLRQSLRYVLAKYTFLLVIMIHTFACIWSIIGCFECQSGLGPKHLKTPAAIYALSIYWSLGTTTNIGFCGASRHQYLESLLVIFVMLYNLCLMSGVFLGAFTAVQIEVNKRRSKFKSHLNLIINHQLKLSTISEKLRNDITNWYINFWSQESGISNASLKKVLPRCIIKDIMYDKYFFALNQSHILRYAHSGLKRALATEMYTIHINQGDIIAKQDKLQEKLIFLAQGIVQVVAPDDIESPIIIFGYGTCIGDICLIMSYTRSAHIIASSYCKLYILEKLVLWRCIRKFHKLKQSKKMFGIMNYKLESARLKHVKKQQSFMRKKSDKTLKLIKQVLKRDFLTVVFRANEELLEVDITDMYVISKTEVLVQHNDKVFVTSTWPWVLYKNSHLLFIWEIIIFIYSVAVVVIYPYVLFYLNKEPIFYNAFLRPMAYVFFVADIILQLFTGIEDQHQNVIESVKEIVSKRCTQAVFLIDVLSVFPFELFFMTAEKSFLNRLMDCNHMFKLIRILIFIMTMSRSFKFGSNVVKIMLYVVYLLYLSYLQGIIYYKTSCPSRPCANDTWVKAFQAKLNPSINVKDDSDTDILMVAVLYGLLILTGTGGKYFIYNSKEIAVISVFCAVFIFLYTYLLADYSATLTLSQTVRVEFLGEVSTIRKYMVSKNMPRNNIYRMNMFHETQWDLTQGIEVRQLMHDLPLDYYEKLNKDKYMHLLKSIPLFKILVIIGPCLLAHFVLVINGWKKCPYIFQAFQVALLKFLKIWHLKGKLMSLVETKLH